MSELGLVDGLFTTEEMRAVWSDESLVESWLEVERAISRALAQEGFLPAEALIEIEAAARLERLDLEGLRRQTHLQGMPIKPLVDQVVSVGGPLVGRWFHWGATTQDVLDSGQALRLRRALDLLQGQLEEVATRLLDMADAHRRTPMVARTNSQDAMPTSWGLQVASYLAELLRHRARLLALRPRATMGMYGGAVGHLSSLGSKGMAVRDRVLTELELTLPIGAWNGSQDGIVEFVQFCALVQGSLVRLANDVETMGRTALGELRRATKQGPSSTMPHKTNPRDANMIQSLFQLGAMYGGQAVHLMDQVDVRAASKRVVSWRLVPEAACGLSASLSRADTMLRELIVDVDRMRRNFAHSRGFVLSEPVMFVLAQRLGRDEAYAMVKKILGEEVGEERSLFEILAASPEVRSHLSEEELEQACRPEAHLGSADALIDEVLAEARAALPVA